MLLALLLSLCAGEQWISPGDWFTPRGELFVWQIRLPRTLAVLLVGAALAISGAVMQALFENPLAEPGLLGVSNGAGVGLIAAVLLGQGQLPNWALGLCAIAGAYHHFNTLTFRPSSSFDQSVIAGWRCIRDYL
ncbi:hmuU domain protein [Shigella dysenteriae 155-74]|nr:hmuU domain protein [Shigella dysenteriae 155-74]EIQ30188.1 fecCD transport family protein [Shigella boydii 965-58]